MSILVILPRPPPQTGWPNDSGDHLSFRREMLLLDTRCTCLHDDLKRLGGVGEDARAIL